MEIAWISGNVLYRAGKEMENKKKLENTKGKKGLDKDDCDPVKIEKKKTVDLNDTVNQSILKDHEVSKKSFKSRKVEGFGLRNFFWEKDMVKQVMTKEKATNLGYVRVLDFSRSKSIVIENQAVTAHATAELRKDKPQIYSSRTILLANFAFVLRIIGYHIVIVGLPNNPLFQILALLILELGYFTLIMVNFMKLKYLLSAHLFISKIT